MSLGGERLNCHRKGDDGLHEFFMWYRHKLVQVVAICYWFYQLIGLMK